MQHEKIRNGLMPYLVVTNFRHMGHRTEEEAQADFDASSNNVHVSWVVLFQLQIARDEPMPFHYVALRTYED